MQHFIGCSSFSDEEPFDPSLFVEFRKRLGMEGYAFLEDLSGEAFNEGTRLMKKVEQYKARLGYYPKKYW